MDWHAFCLFWSLTSQEEFLRRTGIEARVVNHLSNCDGGSSVARLKREYQMLLDTADRTGMGRQFQAMAFFSKNSNLDPPAPW